MLEKNVQFISNQTEQKADGCVYDICCFTYIIAKPFVCTFSLTQRILSLYAIYLLSRAKFTNLAITCASLNSNITIP